MVLHNCLVQIMSLFNKIFVQVRNVWHRPVLQKLEAMASSSDDVWLRANAQERMDAGRTDIFDSVRAEFHSARYQFATNYTRKANVLDVASGTGYGADILYREGEVKLVYGVEFDPGAVRYSTNRYGSGKVRFLNGDIMNLPFREGMFDVVTSFETLEHIEDDLRALSELHRVLRVGGICIVSTPNNWGCEDHPYHVRDYTYESACERIGRFFRITEVYNQNSGSAGRVENHQQVAGMRLTTDENRYLSECFVIVARKENISATCQDGSSRSSTI